MAARRDVRILRMMSAWLVTTGAATAFCVAVIVAQAPLPESKPVDLPKGPAKAGFDISRFTSAGNGWFETFYVKDTQPLRDVLKAGRVAEDTRLLATDTAGGRLALLTDQMAYHHIAAGSARGKDWLVTF
jgi:hypothetical protein